MFNPMIFQQSSAPKVAPVGSRAYRALFLCPKLHLPGNVTIYKFCYILALPDAGGRVVLTLLCRIAGEL
jgi:hypothetical protein